MKKCILFILCFQFLFCNLTFSSSVTTIQDQALLPILTPSFSERQTVKLKLKNGLQAYIISDPHVDKSSAALIIKTGSWEDPIEYPGIAHFLEHMLFLGNKKYPNETEYDQFVTEHGGQFNAFTSNDFTGYVFTIDHPAFAEGLDRFSSFFVDPLFNPSGVDRELQAIDQEYAKNIENDDIREYYIYKELTTPEHPNAAFSMGNRESLQKVSQEALKKWYNDHYSANRMTIEIISSLPLKEIKELVIQDFSNVPNTHIAPFTPALPLISEASKGHMIYIDPVKSIRRLVLMWELPFKFAAMRKTKPELLICHILGYEGKNSLIEELKKEKLAESIQCGASKIGGNNFFFMLQVDLTDAGVKDVNKVILRCFEALAQFKKKEIPNYLVEELQTMTKLNYQYQPREDAFIHIIKEAMLLPNENFETYPEETLTFQHYDAAATIELLNFLTPENCLFELMAPQSLTKVPFESKEKWLGVAYTIKAIPSETLTIWKDAVPNPKIDFPEQNPYLPQNIELLYPSVTKQPSIPLSLPRPTFLVNDEQGKIYFAPDTLYSVPTISWKFEIKTPVITTANVESLAMGDLFIKIANEALSSYIYPASIGGLNFDVQTTTNGISIGINGYSDKSQALFLDLVKALKQLHPREQKFKTYKELLLRDYQNACLEMPLIQAYDFLRNILYKDFPLSKAKAIALRKVTFEKFQEFCENVFKKTYLEGMVYGNIKENQAQHLASALITTLAGQPYPKNEQPKEQILVLPKDQGPFIIETTSKVQGNAAILTLAMNHYTFKERAAQQILMQGIKEPFFSTLRTKQQTGYIVFSKAEELEQHLFDIFAVQSNTHDGRDLLARFELFLEGFLQELNKSEITKERFENIRQALLTSMRQPPQSMSEMVELLYKLAFSYEGDFDRVAKRIKAFEEITYEEFLESTRHVLGRDNKNRLAVIFTGSTPKENLKYHKLSNVNQLREISTFEPAFQDQSHE